MNLRDSVAVKISKNDGFLNDSFCQNIVYAANDAGHLPRLEQVRGIKDLPPMEPQSRKRCPRSRHILIDRCHRSAVARFALIL
jgi:hypothetical protein